MKHLNRFLFLFIFMLPAPLLSMSSGMRNSTARLISGAKNATLNKTSQIRRFVWSFMDSHWKQAQDILPLAKIEQGRKTLNLMQNEYESFSFSADGLEQRKRELVSYHASARAALWHLDHNDDKTKKKAVRRQIKLVEKFEDNVRRGIWITSQQVDAVAMWESKTNFEHTTLIPD